MKIFSIFLLVLQALFLFSGCAARQGWHGVGDFTGRSFEFGSQSNLGVQASKGAKLAKFDTDYAVLLSDLVKTLVEARGISTGPTVAYVGSENYKNLKMSDRRVLVEFGLSARNSLSMSVVFFTAERTPHFLFIQPQPVVLQGTYGDDESFYHGVQAELTPMVNGLLDKAFGEIQKHGLVP